MRDNAPAIHPQNTMDQPIYHIPALLPQTIAALDIHPGGIYIDATMGGCGHTRAILQAMRGGDDNSVDGHLYSFDRDIDAVERALADPELRDDSRFTVVYSNFRYMTNFMRYYRVYKVDGIMADLGVSFHHFDEADRGFSFRNNGPLDMRMNSKGDVTAASLIADADADTLTEMLSLYGELRNARQIARAIIRARAEAPVDTTERLLQVVSPLINPRKEKKELAQVFQALRIVVNDELGALRALLTQSLGLLRPSGRLAILTYNSLEDRLVKNFMKTGNLEGHEAKDFYGRSTAPLKPLGGKPIVPDDDEVERNPRSRSAKLRVAVRLGDINND